MLIMYMSDFTELGNNYVEFYGFSLPSRKKITYGMLHFVATAALIFKDTLFFDTF